jgi:16S rRNA processing protein RimM
METTSGSTSSTERPLARIAVGRVVGAHGLRGQLRVRCFGAGLEVLERVPRVLLVAEVGEAGERPGACYPVESVAPGRRGELRVALGGLEGREAAEALRGRQLWVEVADLEALPAGEYYGYEIVGCRVEAEDGTPVGTVREIWETAGPDLLVVEDEGGREQLLPAALLQEVDVEARRVVIELLPGLLDGD